MIDDIVERHINEESIQQKYKKVEKTIKSCKTKEQCDVAWNMVKEFETDEIKDNPDEWDAFTLMSLLDKQYKKVMKKASPYRKDDLRRPKGGNKSRGNDYFRT